MELINYTLPEWVFLDANCHTGNALEYRTVIQHVRSYTIIEIIDMDNVKESNFNAPITHDMTYINDLGIAEHHKLVPHFTLSDETQLLEILKQAAQWYYDYLTWEDENIKFFGDDTNGN